MPYTRCVVALSPRVVVLTTYYRPLIGGVESNAERLGRFLVGSGCGVTVLTKRLTADLPDEEVAGGARIVRIGPLGGRAPGGKWRAIPAAARWLVRHRGQHDVVCCIDYRGIGCAALLARTVSGRAVVFQAQTSGVLSAANADAVLERLGIGPGAWLGRTMKSAVTRLYRRADAFACISREIERETLAAGVPAGRVRFLPNPVDMTQFKPASPSERQETRRRFGVEDLRLVCVFAGRLSREKGLMDLLAAWQRLSASGALGLTPGGVPLLLVAGPDMDGHAWDVGASARAFVEEHDLRDSVRFLGPQRDVAPLYQAADLAVVPSHFEALGLSAIEALASGVPIVASAVGGLLDFVRDGVNGALCPPESPVVLADRLSAMLHDAEYRRRLASCARSSIEQEYDERMVFGRFRSLLEELAPGRTRTARPGPGE